MSPVTRRRLPIPRFEVERSTLACGATLIVSPRAGATVTAMRVHMRGGPSLDPAGQEGLAYLTGALVDQGTREHNDVELAELLEPAGGHLGGDARGLVATVAGGGWRLLLNVLCEVLTRPTYPEAKVARQKARVLSRLLVERDDPRAQAAKRFRRLIYGKHWLGRPMAGTVRSVESISADDLRRHHADCWLPNRATIVVCGDVAPRAVRRELDKLLVDWRPRECELARPARIPPRARRVAAFKSQREQVHLFLGHLGVKRDHPDYARLVVLDHILGTGPGFTNRISRKLRDELGLAYTVYADQHSSAGLEPGHFQAYIGTSPEHAATAVRGFLAEMRRIQREPVQREELETAKGYLLGAYPLSFERASSRAGYLTSAHVFGLPDDNLDELLAAFDAVTREDVQRVANDLLYPDLACLAGGGPLSKAQLEEALRVAPDQRRKNGRNG